MARASVPPKFFLIIEEIENNSKLNGTWAKKRKNIFLGLWENITSSQTLLLKVTPICCFSTFLARADPRGSCTIPSVVGKRLQLISHAIVQKTLFFSTSALVNNVLDSRATVGHSTSWLNQRKSRRPSLFISKFSTVFFKTLCSINTVFFKTTLSIQSNIYQYFSRLRLFIIFYFCVNFLFC